MLQAYFIDRSLWTDCDVTGIFYRPFVGNSSDDPLYPTENPPIMGSDAIPWHNSLRNWPSRRMILIQTSSRLAGGDYATIIGIQVTNSLMAGFNLITHVVIYTSPGESPVGVLSSPLRGNAPRPLMEWICKWVHLCRNTGYCGSFLTVWRFLFIDVVSNYQE